MPRGKKNEVIIKINPQIVGFILKNYNIGSYTFGTHSGEFSEEDIAFRNPDKTEIIDLSKKEGQHFLQPGFENLYKDVCCLLDNTPGEKIKNEIFEVLWLIRERYPMMTHSFLRNPENKSLLRILNQEYLLNEMFQKDEEGKVEIVKVHFYKESEAYLSGEVMEYKFDRYIFELIKNKLKTDIKNRVTIPNFPFKTNDSDIGIFSAMYHIRVLLTHLKRVTKNSKNKIINIQFTNEQANAIIGRLFSLIGIIPPENIILQNKNKKDTPETILKKYYSNHIGKPIQRYIEKGNPSLSKDEIEKLFKLFFQ